jgi:replicative superfamily II helicase
MMQEYKSTSKKKSNDSKTLNKLKNKLLRKNQVQNLTESFNKYLIQFESEIHYQDWCNFVVLVKSIQDFKVEKNILGSDLIDFQSQKFQLKELTRFSEVYLAILNFSILVLHGSNTTYLLNGMIDDTKRNWIIKQKPIIYTNLHFLT